jgi:hypothetical protein
MIWREPLLARHIKMGSKNPPSPALPSPFRFGFFFGLGFIAAYAVVGLLFITVGIALTDHLIGRLSHAGSALMAVQQTPQQAPAQPSPPSNEPTQRHAQPGAAR